MDTYCASCHDGDDTDDMPRFTKDALVHPELARKALVELGNLRMPAGGEMPEPARRSMIGGLCEVLHGRHDPICIETYASVDRRPFANRSEVYANHVQKIVPNDRPDPGIEEVQFSFSLFTNPIRGAPRLESGWLLFSLIIAEHRCKAEAGKQEALETCLDAHLNRDRIIVPAW